MKITIELDDEREKELRWLVDEYSRICGPFKSPHAMTKFARTTLRLQLRQGSILDACYDQAGNCIFCGESGRCLGVHVAKNVSCEQS
jgi:hypothetical protein